MTIPHSDFGSFTASRLGAILYREPAGLPVEIELEDSDGTTLGWTDRLYLVELQDPDGKPRVIKLIGRLSPRQS